MLARALTTVARVQQQPCRARPVNFDDHLAATDELKSYDQEEDDEDNADEEGEEAGALRQEDDEEEQQQPQPEVGNQAAADILPMAPSGLMVDRLRSRRGPTVSGASLLTMSRSDVRNLRQDKSELVAEGETAAAAAAAAAAFWRPFESAGFDRSQQGSALILQSHQPRGSGIDTKSSEGDTSTRLGLQQQQQQQQQEHQQTAKPRIKKPLNAFMLYMRDHRAAVAAEHSIKESAEINRLLGRQWQSLSRQEQAKYYHLAQLEKDRHCRLHPNWSAKDNYGSCSGGAGLNGASLGQSQRRQTSLAVRTRPIFINDSDLSGNKKCRAVYGVHRQDLWCGPCRRKKRCSRFTNDKSAVDVAMETVATATIN